MTMTQSRNEQDRVVQQIGKIINECMQWRHGAFSPKDTWQPTLNVYRLSRRVSVCVDLAGVDKSTIDVNVSPGLLLIRGVRQAPEPEHDGGELSQIVCMEIDHGPFCRQVRLPERINLSAVTSKYKDGFLWIELPIRGEG